MSTVLPRKYQQELCPFVPSVSPLKRHTAGRSLGDGWVEVCDDAPVFFVVFFFFFLILTDTADEGLGLLFTGRKIRRPGG